MSAENQNIGLEGYIYSDDFLPIENATIRLINETEPSVSTLTDKNGLFRFPRINKQKKSDIKVLALGYEEKTIDIDELPDKIYLSKKIVELPAIDVTTKRSEQLEEKTNQKKLSERLTSSLVSNNPISALRQPQLVKQGSNHSSKIRVNGSSPSYFFNGNPIGDAPNHYGMFSIVPSSVVGELQFYPSGTSAEYQSPTVLDIAVQERFTRHENTELELSAIQTTGTYSTGTKNYFITGAVRKSVLDKLVQYVNYETDRRTTPPTNFQDIAVTTGIKITDKSTLYINHLNSYDFLEYKTNSTKNNLYGLSTFQHTDLNFTGIRFKFTENSQLYNIEFSRKSRLEKYHASPPLKNTQGLRIELSEQNYVYNTKFDVTFFTKSLDIKSGYSLTYIPQRNTELSQENWNFLSPDAPSNSPFIYQYELNQLYEHIEFNTREFNSSYFISFVKHFQNVQFENGFRFDNFSMLNHSGDINFRTNISYSFDDAKSLSAYYGTFSENPVDNILENYQVLIRNEITNLKPVHTKLASFSYRNALLKFSVFHKHISEYPEPVFDFSKVNSLGYVENGFIRMESSAKLTFTGGDIAFDKTHILGTKFDIYTYYGYTHADKDNRYSGSAYELNAPHKFYMELYYPISQSITLGTDFSYRSGYSYTPHISNEEYLKYYRYSNDYIFHVSAFENSGQFPDNYMINFSCMYKVGEIEFLLGVSNITNRGNPVIATSDGNVYDAGIMPSLGFKWKL